MNEMIESRMEKKVNLEQAASIVGYGVKIFHEIFMGSENHLSVISPRENPDLNGLAIVLNAREIFLRQTPFADGDIREIGIRGLLTPVFFGGTGSTGTAAIWGLHNNFSPLSILADPDTYELKNKPRQYTEWGSKGEYKAENSARRLAASFPFEPYFYNTSGVERQNVDIILSNLTKYVEAINLKLINEGLNPIEGLVIDAVDVTSQSGWENKFLLHQAAYMNNIDVINALDIGNRSVVTYYDYSKNPNLLPLDGKVSANEVIGKDALPHFDLNTRIIPNIFGIPNVDYEYAEEYVQRAHKIKAIMESGDEASIPGVRQEKIASDLFAARVPYMLKKLLLGEKLQKEFSIHADNKELTTYNFIRVAGLFIRNYRLLKVTAAYEHQMG